MESLYNLIQANPRFFAWAFGLVNALWIAFAYFNRQSHERALERLKSSLQVRQIEAASLLKMLMEIEEVAGEAKELVMSYKPAQDKRDSFWPLRSKLEQLTGQLTRFPKLMQAIRDFNHYSEILVQDDPHKECRTEVLQFFSVLLAEVENVRKRLGAA